MASNYFASAFVGGETDTLEPADLEKLHHDLDDIVGGVLPCEKCGTMVEFEVTMAEFANGITCSTCSEA